MKHQRSIISIAMATLVLVSLCAVCASPLSVNAADGSTPLVQAPGTLASTPGNSAPAVREDAYSLDVFVKGYDGALWYRPCAFTTCFAWKSLGGILTSDPAVVSPSTGKIAVFARGTTGALYEKSTTDSGTTWSGWANLGGQLLAGTGPAAYSSGSATGWFVTGTNHQLYWSTGSSWTNLGGYLTSSPAAASSASGVIDVFARGSNGALYTRHYSGSWGPWTSLGGQLLAGTSPAASSWGSGRTDWFVTGTNHQLYHSWTGHTGWENLGGYLASSPAAAAVDDGLHVPWIEAFVRGSDGELWFRHYNEAGEWSGWTHVYTPL